MIGGDPVISAGFDRLFKSNGLNVPGIWDEVDGFDEMPLYLQYSQLDFLEGLSFGDRNRCLISAGLRLLGRIHTVGGTPAAHRPRPLRMLSITGWWDYGDRGYFVMDGTTDYITPHIWMADLGHPNLENFVMYRPRSVCAAFVQEVVTSPEYGVLESSLKYCDDEVPNRVYVVSTSEIHGRLRDRIL